MAYECLSLEKKDKIAIITIQRPPMNPLNTRLIQELGRAADEVQADPEIKALIITGSGDKAFCAGADLAELVNKTAVESYAFSEVSRIAFAKIANLDIPVIAAVNGLALGGGTELSLTCDFRIVAEKAKFGQPEINLGLIPGAGGTQRLPRLIGTSKAKEMIFLGEMVDASTAEKLGLANKVVPQELLMAEAEEMANKLAAKPAVALKLAKQAINSGVNMDLTSALKFEVQAFVTVYASDDCKEGTNAFLEKRKPCFTDK
jgi:enoyl-CoA hydratase